MSGATRTSLLLDNGLASLRRSVLLVTNLDERQDVTGSDLPTYDQLTGVQRNPLTGNFLPGSSGNPHGRPKRGESYADLASLRPVTKKMQVVLAMEREAIRRGSVRAAEFLRDTAEGKPATRIIVTQTDAESPLVSALQAAAREIMAARGTIIEGEARVLQPGAEQSSVGEVR